MYSGKRWDASLLIKVVISYVFLLTSSNNSNAHGKADSVGCQKAFIQPNVQVSVIQLDDQSPDSLDNADETLRQVLLFFLLLAG